MACRPSHARIISPVYQAIITRRYLFSRIMPLLAAVAVALCTGLVLTVWSVMGGFLNMLLSSGKQLIGDVSISWPVEGIPYYAELVEDLERDPLVGAATPTLETVGLLALPSGEVRLVQVVGIEPEGYDRVTDFHSRLWWRPIAEPLKKDKAGEDPRLGNPEVFQRLLEDGKRLAEVRAGDAPGAPARPAIVLGLEVSGYNVRTEQGFVQPRWGFGPAEDVTLTVMPFSRSGVLMGQSDRVLPVANEFRTGLYEIDAKWVIVPLDVLQEMLALNEAVRAPAGFRPGAVTINEKGEAVPALPPAAGIEPARVTNILVRAAEGVTAEQLQARCEAIYTQFAARHVQSDPSPPDANRMIGSGLIFTWDRKPGLQTFIQAVKKETALVLVLFSFISLTAVFLVFSIFWSMISEKTRDIGVLRAIGAGRAGIAWLFLRYGLILGAVGSLAGGALAYLIVLNINPIHEWMGRALGLVIWDPKVYYFTDIPNEVDPVQAIFVLIGGVTCAVLGAVAPAIRAAWMDPVRALRFE